jgi:hypothetical protein
MKGINSLIKNIRDDHKFVYRGFTVKVHISKLMSSKDTTDKYGYCIYDNSNTLIRDATKNRCCNYRSLIKDVCDIIDLYISMGNTWIRN